VSSAAKATVAADAIGATGSDSARLTIMARP
jgi:hypothetical protein